MAAVLSRLPTPSSSPAMPKQLSDLHMSRSPANRTPSPPISPAESNDSSGSRRKRVDFQAEAKYLSPLKPNAVIRPIMTSRHSQSIRSILKNSPVSSSPEPNSSPSAKDSRSQSLVLLRSALQHLRSDSLASRQDAYTSLLACLSAYSDLPEAEALRENMSSLLVFIQRDLNLKDMAGHVLDLPLTTKALQFVAYLLFNPTLAVCLSEDFQISIVQQAITVLEDNKAPKSLVALYLHILQRQRFENACLNRESAVRVVRSLGKLCPRVKGNRILGQRLMILQRILSQHSKVMQIHIDSWFDILLSGLCSKLHDLRRRAIDLGLEAALSLGVEPDVTSFCMLRLNSSSPEGVRCVDRLVRRLEEMCSDPSDAVDVPSAWSIILLFLRGRPQQIERWEHLRKWLMPLQTCFNSTEEEVKSQTNIAWGRFIFAIEPSTCSHSSLIGLLLRPICAQLRHKRSPSQMARSIYHILLYHAFRPGTARTQLDRHWDVVIDGVLPRSLATNDPAYACSLLNALLRDTNPKWTSGRAIETAAIDVAELPSIDNQWLQLRVSKVAETVTQVLARDVSASNVDAVLSLWQNLLRCVKSAPLQHQVTRQAIAFMLDCLRQLSAQDPQWKLVKPLIRVFVEEASSVLQLTAVVFDQSYKAVGDCADSFQQQSAMKVLLTMTLQADQGDLINLLTFNMPYLLNQSYLQLLKTDGPWNSSQRCLWSVLVDRHVDQLKAHTYRNEFHQDILDLLMAGVHIPYDEFPRWRTLFEASESRLLNCASDEQQKGFPASVFSPLILHLDRATNVGPSELAAMACVLKLLNYNWISESRNPALQSILELSISPQKLFDQIMSLLAKLLEAGYQQTADIPSILADLRQSKLPVFDLPKLESGLALWIEDSQARLAEQDLAILHHAWAENTRPLHRNGSAVDQRRYIPGFKSRHSSTVKVAVDLWNEIFGTRADVEYDIDVCQALVEAKLLADVKMPGRMPLQFSRPQDIVAPLEPLSTAPIPNEPVKSRGSSEPESSPSALQSGPPILHPEHTPHAEPHISSTTDDATKVPTPITTPSSPSLPSPSQILPARSSSGKPQTPGGEIPSSRAASSSPREDPASDQLLAEMHHAHSQSFSQETSRKRSSPDDSGKKAKKMRVSPRITPASARSRRASLQHQTQVPDSFQRPMDRVPDQDVQKLIRGLRGMVQQIPQIVLRPEEERSVVDLLFELVRQTHEAGRRHTRG